MQELVANGQVDEAAASRRREVVYSGVDEATVWSSLTARAEARDDIFAYKTVDLPFWEVVWRPTLNSNSFVTSILRAEAVTGTAIQAFETDLNEPGNQIWIGTSIADVLNADTFFASGDQMFALLLGKAQTISPTRPEITT